MMYVVSKSKDLVKHADDAIVVKSYRRAVELADERKANVYEAHWDDLLGVQVTEMLYSGKGVA